VLPGLSTRAALPYAIAGMAWWAVHGNYRACI